MPTVVVAAAAAAAAASPRPLPPPPHPRPHPPTRPPPPRLRHPTPTTTPTATKAQGSNFLMARIFLSKMWRGAVMLKLSGTLPRWCQCNGAKILAEITARCMVQWRKDLKSGATRCGANLKKWRTPCTAA